MLKMLRRHFGSPPMILAIVALFIALGGAAYAGFSLPNNSVRSNHIANGQVRTADIANLAVTSAKINNNAVNSAKIRNGSVELGDLSAGTISSLQGGTPGGATPKLWAVVSDPAGVNNATLVRGNGVVSVSESTGVLVRLNQSVANCAWIANRNGPATVIETAGFAQVALSTIGTDILDVRTRTAGGAIQDGNFHLEVLC